MTSRILPTIALLLSLAPAVYSASNDDESAHAALRQIKTIYENAIRTGDLSPLKPLFAPETSAVMILGQEVKSFAELEEHWKYVRTLIGPGGSYSTTLHPERSLIYGDIAVSRGVSDEIVTTGSGTVYKFTSRWTAVSHRIGNEWKVIRLHGSMDPVNNVFTTTVLRSTKCIYGIGGVIVGALLGSVTILLLKKRPATA